ncbi:zinc finger BED domain-containing protein 1-like [Acyrthosiphon pisum]|uniref:BED-type domain-containing protein n=1 Tax=Acyrthosiphon pisum TaxID=7029 RepID=A0A8R2B2V2_ACYPI|nr:zinc finger BED domain-containing protein 1-like [Acyrthosiphon pisum]|eukprot:XP_008180282.1 PREDICTED: zinc finger BED domain-containing protein 1-like [Acyrthosiphon pisum]
MSQVWDTFSKDECGRRATCTICNKSISNAGTNTTNLWNHLKGLHKAKFNELDRLKRGVQNIFDTSEFEDTGTLSSTASTLIASTSSTYSSMTSQVLPALEPLSDTIFNKQTSMKMFTTSQATKLKLDKILAYTIAIDMMPYNVVDREGFQLYTRALCPSYKLPSRRTLTDRRIPDLYKETKMVVENILTNLSCFSLTTDCWTSVSNKPFMAVTCHYLNAEFKLDNVCLGCQELIENHTSENLSDALQLMLLEYNKDIDICIGAITTDYGANILKAVKNLDVPHIPCFGHSFNTAVKNVFKLKQVNTAIEKIKSIQNIFAYSWKSVREKAIEQKRFDLKQVKFPSYSKTRWWSMLDLILVVLSQEPALASFLRTYNNGCFKDRMINEQDVTILKTLTCFSLLEIYLITLQGNHTLQLRRYFLSLV